MNRATGTTQPKFLLARMRPHPKHGDKHFESRTGGAGCRISGGGVNSTRTIGACAARDGPASAAVEVAGDSRHR